MDISRYILTELYDRRAETNADVFIEAAKAGILPLDLARRLAKASRLRNFLAHQYEKINPFIVIESIESICVDFQLYFVCLENYMNSL